MVGYLNLNHVFPHPWRDVNYASWRKYPNPQRPDVIQVDLIKKRFDPATGKLYTTRLIAMTPTAIPSWFPLEKLFGRSPRVYFVEEAEIDPKTQTMILRARNITFDSIITMKEKCTYVPDRNNPNQTYFEHLGEVKATPFGVAKQMEEFCIKTFTKNAAKGRDIMEQVIAKVQEEKRNPEATQEKPNLD
eukprot:TRINITY_DN4985_c0_g1_i1.p1 TRINITY_DN4985_c0_g1~~TRINITY_DN4985_c0_g1_i1.p1  ORF type:complete len:203 (+),score=46.62 TRINITY_DN4985_c0_g1_i1:44-610(+)